ncbi:MAG: chromate transporter [Clostridia bacterium]|nr:chromate transporter [Clostridia bacterium]
MLLRGGRGVKTGVKSKIDLFFTMLKIGLFTFGGGYGMIALLEDEFVTRRKFLDNDEFLDMTAIAESTPGPIAINASTYIGYKTAGIPGAVISTVGVCIPSFVIIYLISLFFDAFLSIKLVAYAFRGIQVCVVYLIFAAGVRMLMKLKRTKLEIAAVCTVIAVLVAFSLFAVRFSTILYILIGGAAGLFVYFIRTLREKEGKK